MSYSNGTPITYPFMAVSASTYGATDQKIPGPEGATGRLVAMTAVSTSAITLAAASVNLQTVGGGTTFGSLPIPVSGTGAGANALSIDDQGASPADASRIPADTVLELHSDGGAETGEADIYVTILWDNV